MSEGDKITPQVLLILQDNQETGELEIGGVQRPLEFDPKSPAHVVGQWLANNMEHILVAAGAGATVNPDEPAIIAPDRERTIITETGRRDLLADEQ